MLFNEIFIDTGKNPKKMIIDIFHEMNLISIIPKNARICLKPNLVFAKKADTGATTHPEIIEGIIEYLNIYHQNNISIIESSSIMENTSKAFEICGYNNIAKKYGVNIYDLKHDSFRKCTVQNYTMEIALKALDCDFFINIPVLKGHSQTKYTGALKNLKGCLPDHEKRKFHRDGLHQPIAFLNKIIKTSLIVLDALNGDFSTEFGGNPAGFNMIAVGTDPVLIDTYALSLLGIELKEVPYISLAEGIGIGSTAIHKIKIHYLNPFNYKNTPKQEIIPSNLIINPEQACSICYCSLLQALNSLGEQVNNIQIPICIGQGFKDKKQNDIGIGQCTKLFTQFVSGCPPSINSIKKFLDDIIKQNEKIINNKLKSIRRI